MDALTELALSIDNPALHEIGMLIQDPVIYSVMILGLLLICEGRNEKRFKIAVSLALTILIVAMVKEAMAIERPCSGGEWCPESYSFPSLHAAIAFTLMTGFLNKRSYAPLLLFSLLISFSRMNIGVHTFYDVAAALPIALLSYYLTVEIYKELMKHG